MIGEEDERSLCWEAGPEIAALAGGAERLLPDGLRRHCTVQVYILRTTWACMLFAVANAGG